ncbi:MAG: hypothetical protein GF317_04800 [Candidatus Lokiarchaeota archaeon]|nr:hypothetical protein [Candidatus Lokiarchaeota archaeon]
MIMIVYNFAKEIDASVFLSVYYNEDTKDIVVNCTDGVFVQKVERFLKQESKFKIHPGDVTYTDNFRLVKAKPIDNVDFMNISANKFYSEFDLYLVGVEEVKDE